MSRWLIAIDDTDNPDTIGTGRLARMLAAHLVEEGVVAGGDAAPTVTRHQLLVHPDVPYTSHNSSACIAAVGDPGAGDALFELARSFLLAHPHEGANPGLCVCEETTVPAPLPALGRRAQQVVLDLAAFDAEIAPLSLRVWSRGDTGQGRIGAVCGVALRSTGEDGRFLELRGIRALTGRVSIGDLLAKTGVDEVVSEDGTALAPEIEIETREWIRPDLRGGRAVFRVCRQDGEWIPDAKRSRDDG